jgi:hypothetical protein
VVGGRTGASNGGSDGVRGPRGSADTGGRLRIGRYARGPGRDRLPLVSCPANGETMLLPGPRQGRGGRRRFRSSRAVSAGSRPSWWLPGRRGYAARIEAPRPTVCGAGPTARAPALWDARLRASGTSFAPHPSAHKGRGPPPARQRRARSSLLPLVATPLGALLGRRKTGDAVRAVANNRDMPPSQKCRVIRLPVQPGKELDRVARLSPRDAEKAERFRRAVTQYMLRNGTPRVRAVKA